MKKYIILIIILFIPFLVSAKEVPSVFISYKIKVNNVNGISLKVNNLEENKNITIPNNTELEVIYEYEKDGKLYGNVEYGNYSGMIEIKDVELIDKDVNLDDYKSEETKKIYVFGDDVYLYNGPSKAYGIKNDIKIPIGTVLTYNVGDEAWGYVTYNGEKGWIYVYTYDDIIYEKGALVATIYDDKYLYTLKNINLIDSPITNNNKEITVPELTKIKYKYSYSTDPYTTYYYVIYNDIEGWYKYTPLEVAFFNTDDFIVNATEDSNIYEKPTIDSKVLGNIKKEEEYTVLAISINDDIEKNTYESWSYVEYRNIKGFIYHFEKGKEEVKKDDKKEETVVKEENKKENNSLKIIAFSFSIIIIVLFIIYTILKINKKEIDK